MINDKYEGYGKFVLENGDYYEGEFKNGKRNGTGIFYTKNGQILYAGDYTNDFPEGYGKFFGNKFLYEGEFKKGKKNGKGKLFLSDGTIIYSGNFINDAIQ